MYTFNYKRLHVKSLCKCPYHLKNEDVIEESHQTSVLDDREALELLASWNNSMPCLIYYPLRHPLRISLSDRGQNEYVL